MPCQVLPCPFALALCHFWLMNPEGLEAWVFLDCLDCLDCLIFTMMVEVARCRSPHMHQQVLYRYVHTVLTVSCIFPDRLAAGKRHQSSSSLYIFFDCQYSVVTYLSGRIGRTLRRTDTFQLLPFCRHSCLLLQLSHHQTSTQSMMGY
ncbi:uncharacterized protein BO95DRAFT_160728 [Aspergillus brunneoviolaceus CBS 621.78]|uniref:Uncharacterized protein n=1 Tax=Aspergillus brunneoviolaceus CBS 621.78 TaxID=1450534 RepID=A0ACD1GNN4_9EURO|nr:hypothetical protein BO95DRAFT_160728 [Aspergillus brunneoviolaceus CBS 621.78]RAH50734.1 hypothetical protein BO95DRAFT_160728 [Aspergillus brunneoviolaceus CBS 621.78]